MLSWILAAMAVSPPLPLPDGGAGAASHLTAGQRALKQGDTIAAERAFDDCLTLDPGSAACRLALATSLIEGGYIAEGIAYLETLRARTPEDAAVARRWQAQVDAIDPDRTRDCGPAPDRDQVVASVRTALDRRGGVAHARALRLDSLACGAVVPSWQQCRVVACAAEVVGQPGRTEQHTFELDDHGARLSHDPRAAIDRPRPLRVAAWVPERWPLAVDLPPTLAEDVQWIRIVPPHGTRVRVTATGAGFTLNGHTGRIAVTGGERDVETLQLDGGAPAGLLVEPADTTVPLDRFVTAGAPAATTPISERSHASYSVLDPAVPLSTSDGRALVAAAAEPFFTYAAPSLGAACGGAAFTHHERLLVLGHRPDGHMVLLRADGTPVACHLHPGTPSGTCPGRFPHLEVTVDGARTPVFWSSADARACAAEAPG